MNSTYIKLIKAMYQARKNSKNIRLKGMNKFLEAELEASQVEVAGFSGHGEEVAEEPYPRHLRSIIAKRTRSQSAEAGSSQKRAHQESEAKALSKELQDWRRSLNRYSYGNDSDKDDDPNVRLRPRSRAPEVML